MNENNHIDPWLNGAKVLMLLMVLGVAGAFNYYNRSTTPLPLGQFTTSHPTIAEIHCPDSIKPAQAALVQAGMTLAQVDTILAYKSIGHDIEDSVGRGSEVLTKFMNHNGTSVQILFRNGNVVTAKYFDGPATIENERGS